MENIVANWIKKNTTNEIIITAVEAAECQTKQKNYKFTAMVRDNLPPMDESGTGIFFEETPENAAHTELHKLEEKIDRITKGQLVVENLLK